jgi:hypothetical protein
MHAGMHLPFARLVIAQRYGPSTELFKVYQIEFHDFRKHGKYIGAVASDSWLYRGWNKLTPSALSRHSN